VADKRPILYTRKWSPVLELARCTEGLRGVLIATTVSQANATRELMFDCVLVIVKDTTL